MLVQRPIGVDEGSQPIERHERVAVRAGHPLVDLGDDQPRRVRRGERRVDRGAERAVAMAIRRRQLQEGDVERDRAAREQARDVGEENRDEVGAPFIDRPPQRRAGEQGNRGEASLVLRLGERRRSGRVQVIQRHVRQVRPAGQRFDERRRRGGGAVDEETHPARDAGHGLRGRHRARLPPRQY
jgi:hypothetical protein